MSLAEQECQSEFVGRLDFKHPRGTIVALKILAVSLNSVYKSTHFHKFSGVGF